MLDKFILILLEFGFGIKFNIVGVISISELMLIIMSPFYIKKTLFIKFPILNKISYLYIGLFISQLISEIVIGNTASNAMKGLAVTLVSYLHFIFLFKYLIRRPKNIVYVILGSLAMHFIFGSEFEGDFASALSGEEAAFLKFYVAPIIINGLLLLSVFQKNRSVAILFVITGLAFVVIGARSSGLITLLTGMIAYYTTTLYRKINFKRLAIMSGVVCIVGYGLYVIYVNNVIHGNITAGNTEQLLKLENPYSPVALLKIGRSETFVGWVAFMDKPLFGHGAWAEDVGGYYRYMVLKLHQSSNQALSDDKSIIPSHSVLIGSGMQNGIMAFVFIGCIVTFFIKKVGLSIDKRNPFLLIIVSYTLLTLWNVLFSPGSHFRLSLPVYFAFILVIYLYQKRILSQKLVKKQ